MILGKTMKTTLLTRVSLVVVLIVAVAGRTLFAQSVEITPFAGYTFSDGINFDPRTVDDPRTREDVVVDALVPKSGFSYGAQIDFLVTEGFAVGFQFSDQLSDLQIGTLSGDVELTGMNVRNYHGMFTYNFAEENLIPYVFVGLGATQYAFDKFHGNSIEGATKFSSTWGGGVKFMTTEHIGVRLTGRWTPTYINTEADGIWCSPYWPGGCWVVGKSNYADQFELSGGFVFRF